MNPELNVQNKQIKENVKDKDNYTNNKMNFQANSKDEITILKNAIENNNFPDYNNRFLNNFEENNLFIPNLKDQNNSNFNPINAPFNSQQQKISNEKINIIKYSQGNPLQNQMANNDLKSQQLKFPKKVMNMNVNEIISQPTSHLNPKGINKDNIFIYLRDKTTTNTLEREIMGASEQELDYLINEFKGLFRKIIKNENGSYLCSDLFKACSQKQRIIVLN